MSLHTEIDLADVLARAARLYPDRLAVVAGDVRLTYRSLAERVGRLAAGLARHGLVAGDRLALLDRNSFRYMEVNFACAVLGVILVPLNIRLAAREIANILGQIDAKLALVAKSMIAVGRQALEQTPGAPPLVTWAEADGLGADNLYESLLVDAPPPVRRGASADIAQIFFTSGTTGEPKGVCLTRGNLVASALDSLATLHITQHTVWLHAGPMFHLVDAFAIWTVTMVGGVHVVTHFDPARLSALVATHRITMTSLPPTLIHMIVSRGNPEGHDLSTLDRISYGGAPMDEALHRRASSFFRCPLLQAYGITETSGLVTQQVPGDHSLDGNAPKPARRGSTGQPAPNIELRVADDDDNDVAHGMPGELCIRGPRVMAGYWKKPGATATAMRGGWYHSGDIGYRDAEGYFYVLDRKKDMIITGGENVYSAEVEGALLSHPGVLEAAVFGVPSERFGEEVKAVVLLRAGASASADDLISHCRARIGGYKVPRSIEFVMEPLPKSGPGKVAKHILREPYWRGRARRI
ncbi:MAG: class I adenylate-forming enzyme family protein [Burkholderiales bacterium]